jgi:ADOP: Acidobacterial duplicated orphan permease
MIFQSMKMAWHAVVSNKLRSFLTMLGIIIGVVALIVLVSIANGATSSVTDQISSMGSSYLTVIITDDKGNPLRLKELSDFCEPEEVDEVAPVSWTSVTAKTSYSNGTMTLTGTTGSYADIQGLELFSGRFLKQTDIDNNSYVVVITKDTATELLGRVDAVGESIKLNGKSFLVVGVLSDSTSLTQGAAVTSSSDSDDSDSSSSSVQLEGYIPFSTMTRLADNVLDVTMFYASGTDEDSLEPAENALTELLMERFGEDEDAFSIVDQSEIMEAMSSVTNTMSLMIGGIAAISLLVGGIGIMNIMLVSVTERTREIGIRKAIGAGRETIMLQFLIEALLVSLMGCLAGIGLSWVILKVAAVVMKNSMSFTMDMKVVWLSVAFSVLIGVLFGLYPANKAASKKPIDALRYSG